MNTINLATYAIAGGVAFALVGVIGLFLMRSVIKNLRSNVTDEEEIPEIKPLKEGASKGASKPREVSEPKKVTKPKGVSEPKKVIKPKVVSEPKKIIRPKVEVPILAKPRTRQIIFTKLSDTVVGESFSMILEESLNIGRVKEKNDWAITNDHTVSSKHCKLYIADEKVYIIDLNSTNGTYVNQVRITHPVALKDNDIIRMGSGEYQVVIRG